MGVPVPVICCLIAGVVIALIFCGAFFVELIFPKKTCDCKEAKKEEENVSEFDIDEMLSKLEEKTANEEKKVEPAVQPIISKAVKEEKAVEDEAQADDVDIDALFKQLEEEAMLARAEEEANVEEVKVEEEPVQAAVEAEVVQEVEPIVVGPNFDYNVRIQTICDSLAKLEKDLSKASREVNKYDKMSARKERNEKLLDRKSAELANLNLVLYNVNNIGDVDPEKKKKQEDLVEHIAELKSSIMSADEYLKSNAEKYENSKKIKEFLTGEKERYNAEIAELEHLIKAGKKN